MVNLQACRDLTPNLHTAYLALTQSMVYTRMPSYLRPHALHNINDLRPNRTRLFRTLLCRDYDLSLFPRIPLRRPHQSRRLCVY